MTILVTANDAIDFTTLIGEPTVLTPNTFHDDTYTTYAIKVGKQDTLSMDFTSSTSGWIHWHTHVSTPGIHSGLSEGVILFELTNVSGDEFLRVVQTVDRVDNDFPWRFERWDGTAFVRLTPDIASIESKYIDIEFKIDAAVGFWVIYENGQEIARFDGKTDHNGNNISSLNFLGDKITTTVDSFNAISQLIITDSEITIDMRLATLDIDGEGATSAWTGVFTDINDQDFDINQKITSGTANEVSTYTVTGLSAKVLASTFLNILSVNVHHYIRDNIGSPNSVQQVVRPLSTDFFSPTDSTIGPGLESSIHRFTTNPDTATNWLLTEIAALEIGAKSIT